MYRSIYYNIPKQYVRLGTWDDQGKRINIEVPFNPYIYIEHESNADALSIFNTKLIKKEFKNSWERNKYIKNSGLKRIFYNIPTEQQFLIDTFKLKNSKADFSKYPLKIAFIDIETYSPKEFPNPKNAPDTINVITIYDSLSERFYTWGIGGKNGGTFIAPDNVIYCSCENETELLTKFLKFWKADYPDIVTGWNCISNNQYVWTKNKIVQLSKITKNIPLFSSENDGNMINNYMKSGLKEEFCIETEMGHRILCSNDHIFPVYTKSPSQYKNLNTMLKTKSDTRLKDINETNDNYLMVDIRNNTNDPLTYKQYIIDNWHILKTYKYFNFKITSMKIRDSIKNHKESIGIPNDYWQGKSFWKRRGWEYQNLKEYISDELILDFIKDSNSIIFCSRKRKFVININDVIESEILRILGFTFTDGCIDFKRFVNVYSSKYKTLTEFYTNIYNNLFNKNLKLCKPKKRADNNYYKATTINNKLAVLLPLIYDNDNKKHLTITPLSCLSYEQFCSFYTGLIDGDGCIESTSINLCNFESRNEEYLNILQQILLWNGVTSIVTKHNIGISSIFENKQFINSLHVEHPTRKESISNLKYFEKKNRISKHIKYFITDKNILVKIKKIFKTGRNVEMSDIETKTHYFTCNGINTHNCQSFDIPYIINRINNILGENKANSLSPVGELYCRENVATKYGKYEDHWYIKGISVLDYMYVYKTFTKEKRERYSLNFIAETELQQTKNYVPASDLSSFADNDWQGFCDYNIQDVNILVNLEKQLHYLKIVRKLAYMGYTNFEQALGTIAIVTGAMALNAIKKGLIIPTFPIKDVKDYAGGFVKDPKRGLIDSIVSFDANSLYPNTIISANISPETKIGKIINKTDTHVEIKLNNDKIYNMPHAEFLTFIQNENIAITKANILYSQKTKGFCPELLDSIYTERLKHQKTLKTFKNKKNSVELKVKELKKESHKEDKNKTDILKNIQEYKNNIKDINNKIIEHDIAQYTLKILLNSIYGTFANKYSPFYDIDAAASVTLTGQECIKTAADITNDYINKTYNITGTHIIYSDTDSIYLTIDSILKSLGIDIVNDKGEITKETYEIAENIESELNKKITEWAVNTCNIKDSRFVFKREKICNSGLFLEKKRYILHVLDDEGLPPSQEKEISYTGVEVVSIKIPKKVKPLIKHISNVMLKTRNKKETDLAYKKAYEDYNNLDVEDIATPTGINNYEKYNMLSNGFEIAKHTPFHVKCAIIYNTLLTTLGIENKYEKIASGDNIKTLYVENNKYNIKGIAFKDIYPKEFNINVDKTIMFNKNITPAVERLYEAVGWKLTNPTRETECDLLELLS